MIVGIQIVSKVLAPISIQQSNIFINHSVRLENISVIQYIMISFKLNLLRFCIKFAHYPKILNFHCILNLLKLYVSDHGITIRPKAIRMFEDVRHVYSMQI